jgi:hypothetical protein
MRYHSFEILISPSGTAHRYAIHAQSRPQGEAKAQTTIRADVPPLPELLPQLEHRVVPRAKLQELGTKLYRWLFVDEVNLLFNRALGETITQDELGLRVRLLLGAPELDVLPWEFLYSPERHLFLAASLETPLSRYISLTEPIKKLSCPEKIHLLAVIPQNSGLDTTAERLALEKISDQLAGKIAVDVLEGEATGAAIRAALRKQAYHLFHYAGHGSFENEKACIHLDHAEKGTELMDADLFAQFFLDYPSTRLVFLNACQGATRSAHQALVGAAPQLVLRGAPAVVAMQYPIYNDDAILFASEFYAELCSAREGGQVEVALSRARKALLQERPDSPAFGNPVLYLRAEDGRLWETKALARDVSKPAEKKSLLERWQLWVGLVAGILAILIAVVELPEKINNFLVSIIKKDTTQTQTVLELQTLTGQILDENHKPLPGVVVILTEYGKPDTTDQLGRFEFEVEAPHQARVSLKAIKAGYQTLDADPSLDGHFNTFQMEKEK